MPHFGLWLKQLGHRCVICDDNPQESVYLCGACANDLTTAEPFLLGYGQGDCQVLPAFAYVGVVARAIACFKADNDPHALPLLIHGLARLADRLAKMPLPADTVILPVPTTPNRLAQKGFYGVGNLAKLLATMTGLPLYTGVVRVADGVRQRGLGRSERLNNVKNAFAIKEHINAQCIIIFDDVITTGATVGAICDVLATANPSTQLLAICLAHGH